MMLPTISFPGEMFPYFFQSSYYKLAFGDPKTSGKMTKEQRYEKRAQEAKFCTISEGLGWDIEESGQRSE